MILLQNESSSFFQAVNRKKSDRIQAENNTGQGKRRERIKQFLHEMQKG